MTEQRQQKVKFWKRDLATPTPIAIRAMAARCAARVALGPPMRPAPRRRAAPLDLEVGAISATICVPCASLSRRANFFALEP